MSIYGDGAPAPSGGQKSNGWQFNGFSDGINLTPSAPTGTGGAFDNPPGAKQRKVNSRFFSEGSRGASVRAAVYARYFAYFMAVIGCCWVTEAALATTRTATGGGKWMLFAIATMLLTAMIGIWRYPPQRKEVVEQARHYIFGLVMLPGTGLAIIMWAAHSFLLTASANQDVFGSLLGNALPIVFFCTVVIPAFIFIKVIAGMRYMNRSRLDDQELVSMYTRQDGYQR